jgi:hypothetical protein
MEQVPSASVLSVPSTLATVLTKNLSRVRIPVGEVPAALFGFLLIKYLVRGACMREAEVRGATAI